MKYKCLIGCSMWNFQDRSAKPAPIILRPFSGLFNPYPYGCSVLCNHPADCEAKEILRRAKDLWVKKFL